MRYDKSNNSEFNLVLFVKSLMFGILFGGLSSTLLLVLWAIIFTKTETMPSSIVQILAVFSISIGTFITSYITLRIYKSKGLLYGSCTGFLMFFIFTVIGFIISRDSFTVVTFVKFLSMLFMGALGGILGVNKRR